jgi:hypothetical protein
MLNDELGLESFLLYGTGNTSTFEKLRGEGIAVKGSDISRNVVKYKNDTYGDESFFLPDELPDDIVFDGVTAVEVFEHFVDPVATIELLTNHLSERGIICGTTDFYPGGPIEDKNKYMKAASHVSYWRVKSMEYIAKKFRFDLSCFELIRPGSILPDVKFGLLWPNKRFFFLYKPGLYREFFYRLKKEFPILPIDKP